MRLWPRGNGGEARHLAADDANGVNERQAVGVLVGVQRGFMHQAANGEVRHHEPVEFLANQIGGLAAQDDLGAAQMGLQFVQRGFDFPALMIEGRQFAAGTFS